MTIIITPKIFMLVKRFVLKRFMKTTSVHIKLKSYIIIQHTHTDIRVYHTHSVYDITSHQHQTSRKATNLLKEYAVQMNNIYC